MKLKLNNIIYRPIFLSILSAILLSMPWFGLGGGWILFAVVPLLVMQKNLKESGKRGFLWWVSLTIVLWHAMSCYWVSFATPVAVPAIMLTSWIMLFPAWLIFNYVDKLGNKALSYTVLVCGWIVCEWWEARGDISFPWLQFGSAFFNDPLLVQWYSFFGSYGGSLWVIVVNILIFETIYNRRMIGYTIFAVVAPIVCSLAIYFNYDEPEKSIEVAVIQPNIDAYKKFSDYTPALLTDIILELASKAPSSTKLFVAPESALTGYVNEANIEGNIEVARIQNFIRERFPEAGFIVGVSSYDRERVQYNTALLIQSDSIATYHKGKLVLGVEVVPDWIAGIAESIDMGGYVGSLGKGVERSVVELGGAKVGSAICYESIYGEYFSKWADNGAELMAIITNDGWWGNTLGYHQHFAFARLRAIESRRSVVRSANTGISGIIDSRGNVEDILGWDERGVITAQVALNSKRSYYVEWGDIVVRLSWLIFGLGLLYWVSAIYKRKNLLD